MANLATTTYKVTGTREAVNNLWTTFQDMEVDSKDIRLFKLAEHYGIDYEKKQISVRGHIYWAEYEEDEENDYFDVGINVNAEGKLCGDVAYDKVEPIVDAITPVPGGVGSVTTSVLIGHVVDAAEKAAARR